MLSSPENSEDIDLGSLVVRGLRHGWSKVPDVVDMAKSAGDGVGGYKDNDGMSGVQSVYIVLAVVTGLCSLYKCMGGECPAASCDCCDCSENTSEIEFDKAIEEAPYQVKRLAVAACDNTNDRFDSYEGDFRGEYGLNLKLKDNGRDGYTMEGNGHTNRTTEIAKYRCKATVYYSGHACWLEQGSDKRGYQILNIGKFDFNNDIFVGTWKTIYKSGNYSLHGRNVVKALKGDNDSAEVETQQALSTSRDVSSMSIKEIKEELQSYGVNTALFSERDELTEALDKVRQDSRAQDFSVEREVSRESVEEPLDGDKTPYWALEEGVASSSNCDEEEEEDEEDEEAGKSRASFQLAVNTAKNSVSSEGEGVIASASFNKYSADFDLVSYNDGLETPGRGVLMLNDNGEGYGIQGTMELGEAQYSSVLDGLVSYSGTAWWVTQEDTSGVMVLIEGRFDFDSNAFEGKWAGDLGDGGDLELTGRNVTKSLPCATESKSKLELDAEEIKSPAGDDLMFTGASPVEGEKKKMKSSKHGNSKNGKASRKERSSKKEGVKSATPIKTPINTSSEKKRRGVTKKVGSSIFSDFREKCEELDKKKRIERLL